MIGYELVLYNRIFSTPQLDTIEKISSNKHLKIAETSAEAYRPYPLG